ncbi:MAG: hypothetical protein RMZ41_018450 [Nostoc sp. DedVER02]|uniref:hypothetical protein n=1 Tax=Nostoc sp. DedVER02 TaxID=3075405 RepID=UPI002AD3681D|nr:hypothetical protein [Nostoc sp. DedVER02]MDZ7988868.1 hypothetical protein [Nostoc sp. DedVER02]
MKIDVGCERGEYGIKPLTRVRYELRYNTTPVATTDSVGGKRVFSCRRRYANERREPPFGFGSSQSTGTAKTATPSPQRTGSSTIPNSVQKSNINPISLPNISRRQTNFYLFLQVSKLLIISGTLLIY